MQVGDHWQRTVAVRGWLSRLSPAPLNQSGLISLRLIRTFLDGRGYALINVPPGKVSTYFGWKCPAHVSWYFFNDDEAYDIMCAKDLKGSNNSSLEGSHILEYSNYTHFLHYHTRPASQSPHYLMTGRLCLNYEIHLCSTLEDFVRIMWHSLQQVTDLLHWLPSLMKRARIGWESCTVRTLFVISNGDSPVTQGQTLLSDKCTWFFYMH